MLDLEIEIDPWQLCEGEDKSQSSKDEKYRARKEQKRGTRSKHPGEDRKRFFLQQDGHYKLLRRSSVIMNQFRLCVFFKNIQRARQLS